MVHLLLVFFAVAARADTCSITNPPPPPVPPLSAEYKPGMMLQISGNASGTNFHLFRVDWARGLNASSGWSSSGLTLAGGGTTPVTNALLATFNSSAITQADYYSIRLQVDNTSVTNEARTMVYFEPDLYSTNWPRWLDDAWYTSSVLPRRDAAGQTRLVFVNPGRLTPSRVSLFSVDGSSVTSNATTTTASFTQPAIADMDGAAGDEIIVPISIYYLQVFHPDGSSYFLTPPFNGTLQESLTVPVDLDGDGRPEVLGWEHDYNTSTDSLFAWKNNGQLFSTNYPVRVPDADIYLYDFEKNRVVPVDVDRDGIPELLLVGGYSSNSFSLRLLRADGTPANWPTQVVTGTYSEVVAGDLDNDGSPEIVLGYTTGPGIGWVQVYSASGAPRPGWPVQLPYGTAHVILADLDRDGTNEIIATAYNSISVLRPDGSSYSGAWPLIGGLYNTLSSPSVGDVDGDGFAEILVMRDDFIYSQGPPYYQAPTLVAYRRNGTVVRSWQVMGIHGNQPIATGGILFGDLDGDGQAEIAYNLSVMTGGDYNGYLDEGELAVLRLGVPYRPNHGDWPMNYHDTRNTAAGFIAARMRLPKSGTNLILSWPLQLDAAVAQTTTNLSGGWETLSGPVLSNGLYTAAIKTTNAHRWYRLQYP